MMLPCKQTFYEFVYRDHYDNDGIGCDITLSIMRGIIGKIHGLVFLNYVTSEIKLLHDENQVFDKGKNLFLFFGGLGPPMEGWI